MSSIKRGYSHRNTGKAEEMAQWIRALAVLSEDNSQHLSGSSQLAVMLVSGNLLPLSVLCRHYTEMMGRHTCRQCMELTHRHAYRKKITHKNKVHVRLALKPGMMVHICNPSTLEAEAGGLLKV